MENAQYIESIDQRWCLSHIVLVCILHLDRESQWLPSSPLQVGWRPPPHPPRCWWCWCVSGVCSSTCTGRCSEHPGSRSEDWHPGSTGSNLGSHTPVRTRQREVGWEKQKSIRQAQHEYRFLYAGFKAVMSYFCNEVRWNNLNQLKLHSLLWSLGVILSCTLREGRYEF